MELEQRVKLLEDMFKTLMTSGSLPYEVESAIKERILGSNGTLPVTAGGTGAKTLTGVLLGNGTNPVTALTPLSGTREYYVATSGGGATNTKITFITGVLNAQS